MKPPRGCIVVEAMLRRSQNGRSRLESGHGSRAGGWVESGEAGCSVGDIVVAALRVVSKRCRPPECETPFVPGETA